MEKRVLYSAVVLDKESHGKLLRHMVIPDGWKVYCHHMTIKMGELPETLKTRIGEIVELNVETIGISDKTIAVGVTGFESSNVKPHITVAVNVANGGKPFESNLIENWEPLSVPFKLTGVITEITN